MAKDKVEDNLNKQSSSSHAKMLKLHVKMTSNFIKDIDIDGNATVENLKDTIHDVLGIPTDDQRLIHSGKQLKDDTHTLSEDNIKDDETVYLLMRQAN